MAQTQVAAAPARAVQIVHVVQSGETVWTIAQQHSLPPDLIVRANRLQNPDRLTIGDRLTVPAVGPERSARVSRPPAAPYQETIHVIRRGETLWDVARRHSTSVDALARLNRLTDADRVRPGQAVRIRTGEAVPAGLAQPQRRSVRTPSSRGRLRWDWPSRGVITSRFGFRGRRHHHGIDIAASVSTPIVAVRDGTVRFAGRRGAYGLLVVLDHGNGLTTWYGHASRIFVAVGAPVRQGSTIAAVGKTGNVTGPNVHFEVRRDNVPLDPLKFLRSR